MKKITKKEFVDMCRKEELGYYDWCSPEEVDEHDIYDTLTISLNLVLMKKEEEE